MSYWDRSTSPRGSYIQRQKRRAAAKWTYQPAGKLDCPMVSSTGKRCQKPNNHRLGHKVRLG